MGKDGLTTMKMRRKIKHRKTVFAHMCSKCYAIFYVNNEDYFYDESCYGYSMKLAKCQRCGHTNCVDYKEDTGWSNISSSLDDVAYTYI